ncbi:MAG: hypothetical protein II722_07070, partial [Ruminococcus sp.]|nr:hypothetical protein [Ruminococcus sp.]
KVDFGLMAIPCEQGSSDIKFTYEMPFLKTGILLTVGGFAVWGGYVVYFRKKEKIVPDADADGGDDDEDTSAAEEDTDANGEDTAESEEEDVLQGKDDNL